MMLKNIKLKIVLNYELLIKYKDVLHFGEEMCQNMKNVIYL